MSFNRIRTSMRSTVLAVIAVVAVATATTQTASAKPTPTRKAKTWEVKMITQDGKQLFEPADLTIQAGDTVKWLAV
ncbi:MAG: hypothetical protein ABJC26_17185, partial [Gemmatimonadaceae bacterium]